MGEVYEAQHAGLKKRVALKVLLGGAAAQPEVRQRFLREGEAAARIRHPNVVDVTDVGIERELPFLVMEYLEGIDLSGLIQREGRLSPSATADILLPVCAAVHAAHAAGIVHRDLKPGNVFLASDADGMTIPKVLDFGISKMVAGGPSEMTGSGALARDPVLHVPRASHRLAGRCAQRPVRDRGRALPVPHREAADRGGRDVRGPPQDCECRVCGAESPGPRAA
jgi:serine/threonine-protein kinase